MGTIIKGGFFTHHTNDGIEFNEKKGKFEVDGGVLCIQFVESLVLDASEIVYEEALIKPDGEGPFNYREDEGYNVDLLKGD